jgi:O-antigen/teichoic acid export membrane protein
LGTLIPFAGCLYFKGGFETFLYFRCCMTILEIVTINIVASRCIELVRTSDSPARHSDGGRHQSIAWQLFFAAASSILGLLSVWVDRIAVFWSSGVEFYGKYVVLSGAVLFAAGIVSAVSQAFLPTLVRAVKGVGEPAAHVWQDQMRVSLVFCAPVCAFLFVDPTFVREFFFGQAPVPPNFENIVRCLSLYGYLSALARITNSFQVAHGRNEIAVAFNVFSAGFYFPTVFVVASYYGAFGVALGSVAYLTVYLTCFVFVTGRILKNFPGRDIILRAASYFVGMSAVLLILGAGTKFFPAGLPSRIACAIGSILLSMSLLATLDSTARKLIVDFLRSLRLKVFVALS